MINYSTPQEHAKGPRGIKNHMVLFPIAEALLSKALKVIKTNEGYQIEISSSFKSQITDNDIKLFVEELKELLEK